MKLRNLLGIGLIAISVVFSGCTANKKHDADVISGGDDASTQSFGVDVKDHLHGENLAKYGQMLREGMLAKRTVHFEFDSSTVLSEDKPILDAHAHFLAEHRELKVLLEGNTDSRGSREYNIALGERRADSVANYLKLQGVNANQIRTISYGKEKPVALGDSEDAYRQNRRVDIVYED